MKTIVCTVVACFIFALFFGASLIAGEPKSRKRALHPDESADVDVESMLDAIAQVESGNNRHAIGACGERGRCQFLPSTWAMHTDANFFSWAGTASPVVHHVERAHLAWVCTSLRRMHPHLEPEWVAAAWRHGPGAAHHYVREDYARRVANLYREAVERKGGQ